MLKNLPTTPEALITWSWDEIEPYYQELESRHLTDVNENNWLADWSSVSECIDELYAVFWWQPPSILPTRKPISA